MDRRSFLRAGAALSGLAVARGRWASAAQLFDPAGTGTRALGGDGILRVYAVVVDGLNSDEITPVLMPRLSALRASGTEYAAAQATHVAETLPNHTAMVTGVPADRHGVPANEIYDNSSGTWVQRKAEKPSDLMAETLFTTLDGCGTTAAVMSKKYLNNLFAGLPDVQWTPSSPNDLYIPVSDHVVDVRTTDALIGILDANDPRFTFVNLGDVDRSGHIDPTGAAYDPAFRTAVLADTDLNLGRIVDHLQADGRWASSVFIVVADHSMDWSLPHQFVWLARELDNDPLVAGKYRLAMNGGADVIYYTGDPGQRDAVVQRMREIALGLDGVASVYAPADLRIGIRGGDLIAFVKPGWRFGDWVEGARPLNNPLPGNHGHPASLPVPLVVSGGSSLVKASTETRPASTMDVAPVVTWLFGATPPSPGYEGSPLVEAFSARPAPSC
ncbi:MAG: alkaline phosphatase family protein [Actinobacteria bacterium]|nr:alkaline phosphatase family protein [Actinomycetota bacterium]